MPLHLTHCQIGWRRLESQAGQLARGRTLEARIFEGNSKPALCHQPPTRLRVRVILTGPVACPAEGWTPPPSMLPV